MTNQDVANKIITDANKAEYAAADDKALFVQSLIETQNIQTYPCSPLCDWIEDQLAA